ncbi:hypothetical protein FKW77_008679 [Venturia effusa]|uniref:Uncharacterized protein n=1 Tax=Venturia effusa TaxID=50376 RepID=A0A517L5Z6_9PEZI|nr:hypothetical protein FKW77_008679 [Venturia effusa]
MSTSNSSSEDVGIELKDSEHEPFLEEAAQEGNERGSKGLAFRRRLGRRWDRLAPVFVGILTCFCMTMVICSIFDWIHRRLTPPIELKMLGADSTGFVSSLPLETRLFWNDSDYSPKHDRIQDVNVTDLLEHWKSLLPEGNGWLKTSESANASQISVFHQIECLNTILEDFLTTYRDLNVSTHRKTRSRTQLLKTFNCFNYLRQGLMCFADTALEGLDRYSEAENRTNGTLGIGTTHVCRNYQTLKSFAEESRGRTHG